VADNSFARATRVVVIVLDDLHIAPRDTDAVRALVRRLMADLGPQASIGLSFTSGDRAVELTADRAEIWRELDQFKGRQRDPRLMGSGLVPEGTDSLDAELADPKFWDNDRLHKTLEDVSRMLGVETERRKAFILISPGLPMNVHGLFDSMRPLQLQFNRTEDALLRMMEAMRKANVATYAISTRALGRPIDDGLFPDDLASRTRPPAPGTRGSLFSWDQPGRLTTDYLSEIARGSGGFAIVNSASLEAGLARLMADLDHYYMLGFHPDDPGKRWRNLDVTVNRPDVTVRARRGYQLGVATKPPKNKDPLVGLSASVLPKTDLPLKMFVTPLTAGGRSTRLAVTLQVRADTEPMRSRDGVLRDTLKITTLAVDIARRRVAKAITRTRHVMLRPRPAVQLDSEMTYQIVSEWELPPGRYQLRTSARSLALSKGGSVYLTVDVPDYSRTAIGLTGLVLAYADPKRHPVSLTAVEKNLLPLEPVLDRTFVTRDLLRLHYDVWRRKQDVSVSTRIELVSADETVVKTVDRAVAAGEAGAVDIPLSLDELATGFYRLRVLAWDGVSAARREIGFVLK
jgi:VWFA-related protein